MANTIRYTVNGKTIDTNEDEFDYEQYDIENTSFTAVTEFYKEVATGTTALALPIVASVVMVELISDYALTITVTVTAGGGAYATFTGVKNIILNFGTAVSLTYTLTNASGYTAKVRFRQFV